MLRELNALSSTGISVSIPTDADGYLDRERPNALCLFGFKVACEDWRDKVAEDRVFCPMCRHEAVKESWHTTAQIVFRQESARAARPADAGTPTSGRRSSAPAVGIIQLSGPSGKRSPASDWQQRVERHCVPHCPSTMRRSWRGSCAQ